MSQIWDNNSQKRAVIHPGAIEAIRRFPKEARRETGKAIRDLQRGMVLLMPLSRSMASVSNGAAEIRVSDRDGIYRTFYYLKRRNEVLIFHAFVKKTQQTPKHEIQLARRRLREMLYEE